MSDSIFQQIVDDLGGQTKTAAMLREITGNKSIKQQNVHLHVKKGECPPDWVLALEKATEGRFPCWKIRPDLYPPERFKNAA